MSSKQFWTRTLGGLAVVTVLIGWMVNSYYIDQRISFASQKLMLLSELRKEALQRYLDTTEAELRFWSLNPELIEQQLWMVDAWGAAVASGRDPEQELKQAYIANNPYPPGKRSDYTGSGSESSYRGLHASLHPMARLFVSERGYYDMFLISRDGDVFYTVEKENDFATNLRNGPYADSGLAEVFRRAVAHAETDTVAISDMAAYAPSNGESAMFAAKAMHDAQGKFAGVIALQIPTERIVDIMNFDAGMGETGETYLVGEDLLMRSDSRFTEQSTILQQRVDTVTVQKALKGESGVEFTEDYRGLEVLSAYASTRVGDKDWVIMAEVDKAEILRNATSERPMLAGIMLFFYSLAAWSAWFIRRADLDADPAALLAGLDLELDSNGDMADG